jgi:hypothetical protein
MKTNSCEEAGTMRHKLQRSGDCHQVILGETKRLMTPFGGLAVLAEFRRELGLLEAVRQHLPFRVSHPHYPLVAVLA